MIQALEHLMEVFEYQVFELCGHGPEYYVPYMMNDAVEDYLVLRNCRMVGVYLPEAKGRQEASLQKEEDGYILAVRQGDENAFTLYFQEVEERIACYPYHEIGHFWVKGQEQWRQLVYMLGTIHDKYIFLGAEYCNEKELELLHMVEFAPLREWSPLHESIADTYPETHAGLDVMAQFAKRADDKAYLRWIALYRRFPWLENVLKRKLCSPKRARLYQLIYEEIGEASRCYPARTYDEKMSDYIRNVREAADQELRRRGYRGVYPEYQSETGSVLVTEEQPFTILEWRHYTFKIQFMVSACQDGQRNGGFFHGRNRKGWIEKYDYKD